MKYFRDKERILAISDIHGCFDMLEELINRVEFNPDKDVLLFLGDYIDRGKDDLKVIKYVQKLKIKNPESVFLLLGNHEMMCMDYLCGTDDNWIYNGANVKQIMAHQEYVMDFIASLETYIESEDFLFVHAGCDEYIDIDKQDTEFLVWTRENDDNGYKDKIVVHGHTPTNTGHIIDNGVNINIDTGAFRRCIMTCYDCKNKKEYQATRLPEPRMYEW